jgi:hypothetical protein
MFNTIGIDKTLPGDASRLLHLYGHLGANRGFRVVISRGGYTLSASRVESGKFCTYVGDNPHPSLLA